jgi:hypothetical protein
MSESSAVMSSSHCLLGRVHHTRRRGCPGAAEEGCPGRRRDLESATGGRLESTAVSSWIRCLLGDTS